MKKIFIVFGHHNIIGSFNSQIRDTFINEAEKLGHTIDLVNLFDEKEYLPFYNSNLNPPPKLVIDYRNRLEKCDIMFLICLLYTSPSPRDSVVSRMPSSA